MNWSLTKPQFRLGVDLGGTKTEVIALDEFSNERFRRRTATPSHSYDAIISTIRDLVTAAETALQAPATVGIGTPGAISSRTGRLKNSNTQALLNKPLKKDLEDTLNRPIRLANDANCFALSEATDGAAKDATVVFGVIVGTGTGGGIVVNGNLIEGENGIGGEWGHNPLPWPSHNDQPAQRCYCGKAGCIETYLSGPGFLRQHRFLEEHVENVVQRRMDGDASAIRAFDLYSDQMARALATVINILDPNVIVLGGGMSNIDFLYDLVWRRLADYVFSDSVSTPLVAPMHGDSSGVRGAAWLWNLDETKFNFS